jgi:hypothetical protein
MQVQRIVPDPVFGTPAIAEERPRPGRDARDQRRRDDNQRRGGREELAVALDEPGRELRAELEMGADGELLVRIVDRRRNEVVAMLTPEELREMAEATGLPSGLLFQARS